MELDNAIRQAVEMLDPSPERKAACYDAASAFYAQFSHPKRIIITAVGSDDVGRWCIYAHGDTKHDLAGLPSVYRGFPVKTAVMGKVSARGTHAR